MGRPPLKSVGPLWSLAYIVGAQPLSLCCPHKFLRSMPLPPLGKISKWNPESPIFVWVFTFYSTYMHCVWADLCCVTFVQVCNLVPGQRCIKKLSENQTSRMIRATSRTAPDREREINRLVCLWLTIDQDVHVHCVTLYCTTYLVLLMFNLSIYLQVARANFNDDPYVRDFGISVDQKMVTVTGRILPPPLLQYGGKVGGEVELAWHLICCDSKQV